MILIIKQVTKVNNYYIQFFMPGLILFFTGIILISCNTYIKPERNVTVSEKPNDTILLAEVYRITKYAQGIADITRIKAANQNLRIYAEKLLLLQQKNEEKLDSLSNRKNIYLAKELTMEQNKELRGLTKKKDFEYVNNLEKQLNQQIKLFESVSIRSEDNEITTLAIALLSDIQNNLDTLVLIKNKLTDK